MNLTATEKKWIQLIRAYDIGEPTELKAKALKQLSNLPEFGEMQITRKGGATTNFFVKKSETIVLKGDS